MKATALQNRISALESELAGLEGALADLQRKYEATAQELAALRRQERQLAAYRLPDTPSPSWAGICRLMEWPVGSRGGHHTVKRMDPALHALLHLCVFGAYCSVDRVTYAL